MADTEQQQPVNLPEFTIKPAAGWLPIDLKELWEYRELLYFFTWRDIKIRYKQTLLGFAWAVIQPLMTMIVFSVFFGGLAKVSSDGVPYPLFSFAALVPWTLFSEGITRSSNSMLTNERIITKVYFPRMLIPAASILSPFVDFCISFVILVALALYYGVIPTANVVWLPVFVILAMLTALGIGLWVSALNVQYRDFQYTIPFIVQLLLFASPVAYSVSIVPAQYQLIYGLNPMVSVIGGFRWALLGISPPGPMMLVSFVMVLALLVSGAFYFRRMEQTFADVI